MVKRDLFLILMEELNFDGPVVLSYTYCIENYIYFECKKICDEKLFMSYELDDLKFNTQVDLCKRLAKFKGTTYAELLSYSHCVINRYICYVKGKRCKELKSKTVIRYRDINNLTPENTLDFIYYKQHNIPKDPMERYITYDPIPKQVKAKLKPQYREILNLILKFKDFPIDYYCQIKNMKRRTALRKKERFSQVLSKEMNRWKENHKELAKNMEEVFEYCK